METFKNILEIIYYISTFIILYIAYKALDQIKEAKKTRVINSKRDAYKIAADKCEYYMKNIIPLVNNLDKAVDDNNVTFFEKSNVIITNKEIKVVPIYKDILEFETIWSTKLPILDAFNALESFSLFFISGVAEENIGFLTVGTTFCHTIKKYLSLIVILSQKGKHYNNIIALFFIWNNRIESKKLIHEKERIDKELHNKKPYILKTLGTE